MLRASINNRSAKFDSQENIAPEKRFETALRNAAHKINTTENTQTALSLLNSLENQSLTGASLMNAVTLGNDHIFHSLLNFFKKKNWPIATFHHNLILSLAGQYGRIGYVKRLLGQVKGEDEFPDVTKDLENNSGPFEGAIMGGEIEAVTCFLVKNKNGQYRYPAVEKALPYAVAKNNRSIDVLNYFIAKNDNEYLYPQVVEGIRNNLLFSLFSSLYFGTGKDFQVIARLLSQNEDLTPEFDFVLVWLQTLNLKYQYRLVIGLFNQYTLYNTLDGFFPNNHNILKLVGSYWDNMDDNPHNSPDRPTAEMQECVNFFLAQFATKIQSEISVSSSASPASSSSSSSLSSEVTSNSLLPRLESAVASLSLSSSVNVEPAQAISPPPVLTPMRNVKQEKQEKQGKQGKQRKHGKQKPHP